MGARYSRNTGYTISKRTVARAPMRTTQKRVTFGPTTAKFFGLAVLAILALVMLSNTKSATSPYTDSALRNNISQVDQENTNLQLQAERYQAINAISQDPAKAQMVPMSSSEPTYVDKGDVAGVSTARP